MADALKSANELKADLMNTLDDPSPSAPAEPTAPAAEPAAPVEDAKPDPVPTPTATEPKEGDKDWKVPGERLQEEVKKRKEAEKELADLKAQTPKNDPDPDEDLEIDPTLLKAMKQKGFVTKAEAEKLAEDKANGVLTADRQASEARARGTQERQELTEEFSKKGYPAFEIDKVLPKAIEMVGEAHVNKHVLRAAYLESNASEIENVLIKQANANKNAPTASAERPGGNPGVTTPEAPTNIKDRTKAQIAASVPD